MLDGLAAEAAVPKTAMIDVSRQAPLVRECLRKYLKTHHAATSLRSKKGEPDEQIGRLIGRTKGGMNTKLDAVADADGRQIRSLMTADQISDYTGAAALLGSLPMADWLLAERGHNADWFVDALKDKGIKTCIPGRKPRGKPIRQDGGRYKRRKRIEIMFRRLKAWRRIAMRKDRCPKVLLSSVALVATVMFWP